MPRPIGIRIHRGADLVETQLFERDIVKIGRLASAHLRLEDPKVSRIHAVIEVAENKEISIIDMGAAEGTLVNGEKVSRMRLKHGDEIGLGDSRLVVVLDEQELAAMKATVPTSASIPGQYTDQLRAPDLGDVPPPPTTNAGVFATGATDVAALRAELVRAPPLPPSTDVFNAPALDLAPPPAMVVDAAAAAAVTAPPVTAPPVTAPPVTAPPVTAPPVPAASTPPTVTATPRIPVQPRSPAASRVASPPSLLPPLPPIPDDEITPENRFIEVTLRWAGTVTDVRRIKAAPKFTIGRRSDDDLFVPLDGGSHVLLTSAAGQGWKVRFTDAMSGNVTRGGQSAPLVQAGSMPDGDAFALPLTDDTVVSLGLGYHSIEVRPVAKSRVVPILPFFDALWANAALVTLFGTAVLVATVVLMPIGMDSLDDDLLTNPTKFQTLILKPPPKDNSFLKNFKGPKQQKQAAQKESGKMGDKKADPRKDQGRMANKAKDKPTDEEIVQNKMAALFGDKGGVSQLFGAETGGALEAALGGLDGARVASGFGTGGMGLRGGGPGGGGIGVGTLGTGRIGTRGKGSGDAGYGSGEGGLGAKTDRDVTMTQGTPVILGSLDPEIIRRIVREHASQIRYCYESELTRTPGLFGKIVMKWVINGEGRVMQAQVADTQMKNASVENCLATKIKTWVFPKPKGGGMVIVNYPFVFKQGG
jgi:pSer/pThr/pTyr-binding forkhead associated (FHA) protein